MPNLKDKKMYVLHIKNLNQILKHGLKFKKVHLIIRYEQSYWVKPYINTTLITAAKQEFEKEFFNLLNNSISGKAMENNRNDKDMKLVTSQEKYVKYVMKPNFNGRYPFLKELLAAEMVKTETKMNKPQHETDRRFLQIHCKSLILVDIQRMKIDH